MEQSPRAGDLDTNAGAGLGDADGHVGGASPVAAEGRAEPSGAPDRPALGEQKLAGAEIWVTAQRRAEDLSAALQRHGASVAVIPTLAVQQRADEATLIERTRALIADGADIVVVTTGFGFRMWMETLNPAGLVPHLLEMLGKTEVLARGPKASGALKQVGVTPAWVAPSESSLEIRDVLVARGVSGLKVAVQLDGTGDPALIRGLREAGAVVLELPLYSYGAPADPVAVGRACAELAGGRFNAVAFTSAPGASGWLTVLDEDQLAQVRARIAAGSLVLSAVGPMTAEPLVALGLPVRYPDRGRMGALVRLVVDQLSD